MRQIRPRLRKCGLVVICLFISSPLQADEIRIAVASNFASALSKIALPFEIESGHKVTVISGATGKHYAQIINGAPFDAFFSADEQRPQRLDQQGFAIAGSRYVYAIGKLVLWSPQSDLVDTKGQVLVDGNFRYLSIANPKLAPYGRAAKEVLLALAQWDGLQGKMVRGENIGQAFQFVKSGNAELGLVAWSQIKHADESVKGSIWVVPQAMYTPIHQQAVLLNATPATRAFWQFIQSEPAQEMIRSFGYDTLHE